MTYREYLASSWWRARKAAVIRFRGERCERCGCRYRLELHHRTYKRLGHERPEDVELLCWICHQRQHGHIYDHRPRRTGVDMERLEAELRSLVQFDERDRHGPDMTP